MNESGLILPESEWSFLRSGTQAPKKPNNCQDAGLEVRLKPIEKQDVRNVALAEMCSNMEM